MPPIAPNNAIKPNFTIQADVSDSSYYNILINNINKNKINADVKPIGKPALAQYRDETKPAISAPKHAIITAITLITVWSASEVNKTAATKSKAIIQTIAPAKHPKAIAFINNNILLFELSFSCLIPIPPHTHITTI